MALIGTETCGKCKFSASENPNPGEPLICRRNPPATTIMLTPGPGGRPMPNPVSAYPLVRPEQWCGEYRPKIMS